MAYFVTSDRHFFHKNMTAEGDNNFKIRPYGTVEYMNKDLVEAHNSVVRSDDVVLDLGDISMGMPEETFNIYKQLRGNFIMVRGNHDNQRMLKYFEDNNYKTPNGKWKFEFHDVGYRMKMNKMILYFTHFPLEVGQRGKIFNIHGHIHSYSSQIEFGTNIGIDSPEYEVARFGQPLRIEVVLENLKQKMQVIKEREERLNDKR